MSKRKTQEEFVKEVYDLVENEYTVLGKYTGNKIKIDIMHNKCHNIFSISPSNFLKGRRCPYCGRYFKKVLTGYNDIATTNNYLFSLLYNKNDGYLYTEMSSKKVDWICPNCGEIIKSKRIDTTNVYGLSCRKCGDGISYPEKIMYSVLEQLHIEFETQKKFQWCEYNINGSTRKGLYDFYFTLNNSKYIIETDGGWHSLDNNMTFQSKEESISIDNQKDVLAKNHNIEVIRIDCSKSELEYIKNNIINSKINSLYNLKDIDWDVCHKYALSSNVIDACLLYNNGFSVKDIAAKMHKNAFTVRCYLKKGNAINICNYDSYKALQASTKNAIISTSKPVICITTNTRFESISEANRFYNIKNVDLCCKGKRESAGKLDNGTKLEWMYAS